MVIGADVVQKFPVPVRKAYNLQPSCAVVTNSENLNFLKPSGLLRACKGTALLYEFWFWLLIQFLCPRIKVLLKNVIVTQWFINCLSFIEPKDSVLNHMKQSAQPWDLLPQYHTYRYYYPDFYVCSAQKLPFFRLCDWYYVRNCHFTHSWDFFLYRVRAFSEEQNYSSLLRNSLEPSVTSTLFWNTKMCVLLRSEDRSTSVKKSLL